MVSSGSQDNDCLVCSNDPWTNFFNYLGLDVDDIEDGLICIGNIKYGICQGDEFWLQMDERDEFSRLCVQEDCLNAMYHKKFLFMYKASGEETKNNIVTKWG